MKLRAIPGYPMYRISDNGQVWSAFNNRWLCGFRTKQGNTGWRMSIVLVGPDGKKRQRYIHHLVLETFVGPRPEGQEACHNNGNSLDNRVENLRWDTHRNDLLDRDKHGTSNAGERQGRSRLRPLDVIVIRELWETHRKKQSQLAVMFGVRQDHVSRIVHRQVWKHI